MNVQSRVGRTASVFCLLVLSVLVERAAWAQADGNAVFFEPGSLINVWSGAVIAPETSQPDTHPVLKAYFVHTTTDWSGRKNWEVVFNGHNGSLTYKNRGIDRCLTASGGGAGVTHQACVPGLPGQEFTLALAESGAFQLRNLALDKCIQVGESTDAGGGFPLSLVACTASGAWADMRTLFVTGPRYEPATVMPAEALRY